MKLWEQIRAWLLSHSKQTISEQNAVITFEDAAIYAEILAKKLAHRASCAIYCHSEMAAGLALLGCMAADTTVIPLSNRYGHNHCRKILQHASPSCVITDTNHELEFYDIQDSAFYAPERPAFIMYTSGTSGTPKGAMLSEDAILANLHDIADYFPITSSDAILISRPLYHCAVLTGEFLYAISKGTRIVFCSDTFNPIGITKCIAQEKISVFGGTPTLLRLLTRFISAETARLLKHVVVSGECMSKSVGQRIEQAFPKAAIYHVYGLTEAGPRVCYLPPKHFHEAPDCVGLPLTSVKIKICNPKTGQQVSDGKDGILWMQGPNMMTGYYQNPVLTQQTIQNGWLRTGDIACIEANGFVKIKGRADDMIIRAGMNIYPSEIEAELRADSRTRDVLVYKIENEETGTQIGIKITGDFENEKAVRQMCVALLPPYAVPSVIQLINDMPVNGSGKIVRKHGND